MNNSLGEKDSSNESPKNSKENFEQAILNKEALEQDILNLELEKYVFRLYVAGNSPKSVRAIQKLTKICEEHLQGRYELEVIDIYQQPELLEKEQIYAVPTLIKKLPLPLQKLIGDMTNTEKILIYLDL